MAVFYRDNSGKFQGGSSFEEAVFRLSDVPEDWEIRFRQDFIDRLDHLNRPWRYQNFPRPWRAAFSRAEEQRRRYVRDYALYRTEVAFFERLWGRHRFRDYHFGEGDPRRHVDTGGPENFKLTHIEGRIGVYFLQRGVSETMLQETSP